MTLELMIVLVPAVIVVVGVLIVRRAAWQVALASVLAAAAMFAVVLGTAALVEASPPALEAGILLTADAGLIIFPGLLLNEVLRRNGTHATIVGWIERWPVSPATATVILTVGFAPALESITGFGVSLLVTVPVLLQLLPRAKALLASMLSLTIMPWGTAGLATTVAADLSGNTARDIGFQSSLFSAAIFPAFAIVTALLVSDRAERTRTIVVAAGLGVTFALVLIGMNFVGLVPLAGVTAGAVTGVLGYILLAARRQAATAPPWRALSPFLVVVALILVARVADAATGWGTAVALHAGRVSFEPLLSPGLALLIVSVGFGWRYVNVSAIRIAAQGGWKPLVALFGFAAAAQLMNYSGAVGDLAALVGRAGDIGFVVFVPLLAVISGYLVGSNTGANALMVIPQQNIGDFFGAGSAAVALQNSGAGHSIFASVPETLLVLAVAGKGTRDEETRMLRFGFKILGLVVLIMVIGAALMIVL
ncbi:L-lactate permease [Rhodococcus sp. SBT000017]|uniref:L-lactate permease n=1 Tax=Rhodococcus sp. SBT000017 TaxID=1803385 RepID=UPI00160502AC|nr:L-lactate permease [Rhodococcus sp. SBT000017]